MRQSLLFFVCVWCFCSCQETSPILSLAGVWHFALDSADVGISESWYNRSFADKIKLPGTTDDGEYGTPNRLLPSVQKPQILHLTRKNQYIGAAWYSREVVIPNDWQGKPIELKLERVIWQTTVWVDSAPVAGTQESLISPHRFDLTKLLTPGTHKLVIRVDNRKQHDITVNDMAHAYTNETQIMWNGILGEISLTAKEIVSFGDVQIYPDRDRREVRVKGKIHNTGMSVKGKLRTGIKSGSFNIAVAETEKDLEIVAGETVLDITCPLDDSIRLWSEFSPTLYDLKLTLESGSEKTTKKIPFGVRELSRSGSELRINNHPMFLRGTLECCIFPLTGYPPMQPEGWKKVFLTAREWGLNHLRFHSWCPPKVAFQVADSMGFYLQVELPLWSVNVGQDEDTNKFLYAEAERILTEYGNHPSFCFMSLGNELQADFEFLSGLLHSVKGKDARRLYATTSFTFEREHGDFPEPADDFLITQWTKKGWVRGQGVFDTQSPSFNKDYSTAVEGIPVPIITHEIGQYSVYPNLKEIEKYTGVLEPLNFKGIKQELENKGMLDKADDYLSVSGKLAAILYKEEIERAMKTPGINGFQLLDLHDFPGQGTALVGLLDAFWDSKGVTEAADFRQFCSPIVPLVRFPKAVYTNKEVFTAGVEITNFTDKSREKQTVRWSLTNKQGNKIGKGTMICPQLRIGNNKLTEQIICPLNDMTQASQLTLSVALDNTEYKNEWNIWVYPSVLSVDKGAIVVTSDRQEVEAALTAGKKVLYNPDYKKINGLEGKFVPVFWSPVHFPKQAGTMGILCHADHPAFHFFPTSNHSDWQWWSLLKCSKTIVIDSLPPVTPIVEVVDNFVNNRRLANMFEAKAGEGKLLFCSMDLLSDWDKRPEARQLYFSLLNYMASDQFNPQKEIQPEVLRKLQPEI